MAGQIGRHYFEAGLGEMYMVPEKQKYLEVAESSILATWGRLVSSAVPQFNMGVISGGLLGVPGAQGPDFISMLTVPRPSPLIPRVYTVFSGLNV